MNAEPARTIDTVASNACANPVEQARAHLADRAYTGPIQLLSRARLSRAAREFQAALPGVTPHYAVKCNPEMGVLETLRAAGCEFEIASAGELDRLLRLGVNPAKIYYSNPIKSAGFIRRAARHGVRWYAVDSLEEVDKIHAIYPAAALYLRITVSNSGSLWPLERKFGCQPREARQIIRHCANLGADLAGVSFHVGSQCPNAHNWVLGIESALACFNVMRRHQLSPRLLNLGGGFPVPINPEDPGITTIADTINTALEQVGPGVAVIAEPGRALVAAAGCLISEVVGSATRNGQRWLYLDVGHYSGLNEFCDGFDYPMYSDRKGYLQAWTVAGPTCDSIDVGTNSVQLPCDMRAGDRVYIPGTGAYTNSCATNFNGFDAPRVVFVD